MDAIAPAHRAAPVWRDLVARIATLVREREAHPSRTVVLLPYLQLVPVAKRAWAEHAGNGFTPRFDTTRNWAATTAFDPGELDIAGDMGRDLLTARSLLARAGLQARADALAPRVVEAAAMLAPLAAACEPRERAAWAVRARAAVAEGMEPAALQLEAAVSRVAVEWVAASSYATDALLDASAFAEIDLLVILRGLQDDPMHAAFERVAGGKCVKLDLASQEPRGVIALHAATDASDEAERAAACVLRHVAAGRTPVALAATDRIGTRRIVALLQHAGVSVRDEQGWKLSTTRSAAQVRALLDACEWDAGSDRVIDWLKHVPVFGSAVVLALERRVRRAGLREWRSVRASDCGDSQNVRDALEKLNAWRGSMTDPRPLTEWLQSLRGVLVASGQLTRLEGDDAGSQLLDALRLGGAAGDDLRRLPQAARRMTQGDFRSWIDEVLEADSFRPGRRGDAHVAVLPFGQALARPFAAMVLPGCDEVRLPASPEPPGPWTAAQRRALGLPSREELEAAQRGAWDQSLQVPHVDILWRHSDDNGEALLASPLVQALRLQGLPLAPDPRDTVTRPATPVASPQGAGASLALDTLSASAYEDLRRCPYRFFALRQLGLKEADEVESEVDKRDFGNWIHSVLRAFHIALRDTGEPPEGRAALLDRIANDSLAALRVEEGEFLPFHAGWPGVRNAYLQWLAEHEAKGASFVDAETEHRAQLEGVALMGRVDRIDRHAGLPLVIDYKTEGTQATVDRMKDPVEDTQLAFYAALLGEEGLQAAYLNINERGQVKLVPHPRIEEARDLLRDAIQSEIRRIELGAPMPALGEGRACEYCAARGLCRRDWWS